MAGATSRVQNSERPGPDAHPRASHAFVHPCTSKRFPMARNLPRIRGFGTRAPQREILLAVGLAQTSLSAPHSGAYPKPCGATARHKGLKSKPTSLTAARNRARKALRCLGAPYGQKTPALRAVHATARDGGWYDSRDGGGRAASGTAAESNAGSSCRDAPMRWAQGCAGAASGAPLGDLNQNLRMP
jgi:hypothetical protein